LKMLQFNPCGLHSQAHGRICSHNTAAARTDQ
jgi:hypothetical protein